MPKYKSSVNCESSRDKQIYLNRESERQKGCLPRLLNGQLLKMERGTRSSQADCTQRVRTLMLLVGLLIVETFSFLQLPASSQASKQAARPMVIWASRKARQQCKEAYRHTLTTYKIEDRADESAV